MNELMNIGNKQTITSLEIAKLTDKLHKNVMADIRKLIDEGAIGRLNFELSYYTNSQNKKQPVYILDKEASLILATGYNAPLRARIIKRWMELEARQLPSTYLEALKQLVETEEKKQIAEAKVKELKPKADFFDAVADSKTAIEMSAVAKTLDMGFGRNKLFEILRDKYILRQNNEPFQKYIDAGYFRVIEQKYNLPDGSIQINLKTLVYQKGLNFIRGLFEDE